MRTLAQWEQVLESLAPPEQIELGLERVGSVWARLDRGLPKQIVTVAGTNGKGSCVEVLGALATANGILVGQYSSPHLFAVNERIRVAGHPVSDAVLVHAFSAVESAREGVHLTYFEWLTLACFWIFQEQRVPLWLLEIGLGGRLDAVNVLDADVSVITSIGLDHQAFLGPTETDIAREKAGVMRAERPCFSAASQVRETLEVCATKVGAPLAWLDAFCDRDWLTVGDRRIDLSAAQLPRDSVGLAILAMDALERLPSPERIDEVVSKTRVVGRMTERTVHGVQYVFDVGHNPAACAFVMRTLMNQRGRYPAYVICGFFADKDVEAMAPVLGQASRVVLVGLEGPRGQTVDRLSERWCAATGQTPWATFATLGHAMAECPQQIETGSLVLVMGSFRLVADALKHDYFN